MSERRVYYMAHPVGGDVEGNLKRATAWLLWLMRSGPDHCFIAPWISQIQPGADDSDPAQRERGLLDCEATVARCDGIVLVGGRVSAGMRRELEVAIVNDLEINNLTWLGSVAPLVTVTNVLSRLPSLVKAKVRR
jgi:hypothetical protein